MKTLSTIILICLVLVVSSCSKKIKQDISCSEFGCKGEYIGPEFIGTSDIAHQFSNKMCKEVGDKLKELYGQGVYVEVDLAKIKLSTIGMDQIGNVTYKVEIPFKKVADSCNAYTSFDHRGGWGHLRNKEEVLNEFKNVTDLKFIEMKTPEGLQEFWFEWKPNSIQFGCK